MQKNNIESVTLANFNKTGDVDKIDELLFLFRWSSIFNEAYVEVRKKSSRIGYHGHAIINYWKAKTIAAAVFIWALDVYALRIEQWANSV